MRIALHSRLCALQNLAFSAWCRDNSPKGTFREWRLYYTYLAVGKLRRAAYHLCGSAF